MIMKESGQGERERKEEEQKNRRNVKGGENDK